MMARFMKNSKLLTITCRSKVDLASGGDRTEIRSRIDKALADWLAGVMNAGRPAGPEENTGKDCDGPEAGLEEDAARRRWEGNDNEKDAAAYGVQLDVDPSDEKSAVLPDGCDDIADDSCAPDWLVQIVLLADTR